MSSYLQAAKDRIWALTRSSCSRLYYTNGGIGDELMLTAVAAAARAAGRPMDIIMTYPELWVGNSDPNSLQTDVEKWYYARRRGWIKTEITHLAYSNGNRRHIASQMADLIGVKLPENWRPVIKVKAPTTRNPRLIIIQNSCSGARYSAPTKEWPQDRWRQLVRQLAGNFHLVQLGTVNDPALESVEDLRGRTSLREAARLLSEASLFIGLESGLQHIAAAVCTPSVIIYGGRSRPCETGYPFNRNITRDPECAGCGLNSGCPHCITCMNIPVGEVESAVRELIPS